MTISLGFSPCPNDTFIFDALVNHLIDTDGLQFTVHLEDVQTLNNWAIEGKLDVTKISYGVLPLVCNEYTMLQAGGALGKGVGPLLIGAAPLEADAGAINEMPIAIPGANTTAHLLFSLAYPNAANKVFIRYDEIENFVASGKGLGVIIHENRFTYQQKGLYKIIDLGSYWEQTIHAPIPLGGIAIKRNLPVVISKKIDALIFKSVQYAFENNYKELSTYVKMYAQEMEEPVMRQHIDLYVNAFSYDAGIAGKKAVYKLMEVYSQLYNTPVPEGNLFLE